MILQERKNRTLPLFLYPLLAFVLSAFLLKFTNYLTSDGVSYLRLAENLLAGKGLAVNVGEPYVRHPPFYSFLIAAANSLCRNFEFSAHLISMLAFSLSAIPLFLLTRQIYSESSAHWTSLLYATNGFLLIYSNLIIADILFILLILLQLYLAHAVIRRDEPRPLMAILLGTIGGMGYLTRPEGLLYFGIALASILFLGSKPLKAKLRFSILSSVVFLLFFAPYVGFVTRAAGHLQFNGQARENIIYRQLDVSHPGHYAEVKKIYEGLSSDKKRRKMEELVENFSLLHYLKADRFALLRSGLSTLLPHFLGFSNYFYAGLGFFFVGASFLNVPWNRSRKKSELLLILFLLPFLTYQFLLFYTRRYLILFPIFLIWMGNGVSVLQKKSKYTAWVVFIFLLLPSIWYLHRSVQNTRFPWEHKELGLWMRKNIPQIEEEGVAAQGTFVNYYSGARILRLPYVEKFEDLLIYMAHQKAKYFVVSEDLEGPTKDSYRFLLDETKPPPAGVVRKQVLKGKTKMILYEIQSH